ncbi:hypothetical protein KC685_04930 [Candidatus Dojkabacteria bacterium]|uniref:Uncharacterized protein n=1 Tax=Candidatus Dojkabacteria bacterium TaxID=2099670 RepID=A0A955I9Z4_9BACT|nr:hypothetical protein [Candidatus Dojkabacteria bacterium]
MANDSLVKEALLSKLTTDEGLLNCKEIKLITNEVHAPYISLKLAKDPSVDIYPHPEIRGVLDILANNQYILEQALISVKVKEWR